MTEIMYFLVVFSLWAGAMILIFKITGYTFDCIFKG